MIKAVFALGVPSDFHENDILVFGKDGGLPWGNIPEDLKIFKEKTTGCVVVMGAKTFQSLPFKLPGRINVVIGDPTRPVKAGNGAMPDAFMCHDDDWVSIIKELAPGKDIAIIGGLGFIMNHFHICDEIHINYIMLSKTYDSIGADVTVKGQTVIDALKSRYIVGSWRYSNEKDSEWRAIKVGVWK
ncbi:dihydrofolate reductase [Aeromonas phage GomatiRiver_11]|nr:hypothetical protein OBDJBBDK_00023 [Aeromonas phage AhFM11]WKW84191.1 dihydrofolate reductase [Aeromonas phage GomatiRiver_11]